MAEPARKSLPKIQPREPTLPAAQRPRSGTIAAVPLPATARVASIDALRGLSMFFIIGGDGLVRSLGDVFSFKQPLLESVSATLAVQFTHVPWEGVRIYDVIFPLFIFVTGVSIVFSLARHVEREGKAAAHARVFRRALLLYVLGVIYYGGISHHWDDVRLLGVLQRIAICYLAASVLFLNFRLRGLVVACAGLLVGYWALMTFVPVPGIGAGSLAMDANLANWLDRNYLPGRLWDVTRDPEGMLSTLPAIATALFGVFAGILLRNAAVPSRSKSLWLIAAGALMVAAGYAWSPQFPIIKAIWTSSFALVAAGYSAMLLGALYQIMDVWGCKRWATPFVWIGANAITLYFINGLVGFEPFALRLVGGDIGAFLDRAITPGMELLVAHAVGLGLAIALAGYLYRRKIFLRV
jgi:predicted acyltransferase